MNNNNYVIITGAITFEGRSGIPTMEIIVEEKDSARIVEKAYLTPFRGYSFQVSGTRRGEWDHGASSVIAFYKDVFKGLTQYKNSTVLNPVLKGQAMIAITEYATRQFLIIDENNELMEIKPVLRIHAGNNVQLDRFIAESIKWIGLGDDIKSNCEYGRSSDDDNRDVNVVYNTDEAAC